MRIAVESVLFKWITDINARTLLGLERGQYDLRLSSNADFGTFTSDVPDEETTELGGWTRIIPIAPFDGPQPVEATHQPFRYMGRESQRKDFYFPSVTTNPYPLWGSGRAYIAGAVPSDLEGDVALLIRDVTGRYHARWIRKSDISALPFELRSEVLARKTGVFNVPRSASEAPTSSKAAAIRSSLLAHHNVLLYGPPGTGKSHLVREVMDSFTANSGLYVNTAEERRPLSDGSSTGTHAAWTTFHQSYSYEDFLIGLRPVTSEGTASGGFGLTAVPGVLLELAEWARVPGHTSLLVIDEINRGNVSRIFGEFITLMEPDKRLDAEGRPTPTTVSVRLPFIASGETVSLGLPDGSQAQLAASFTMPRDVFTLATMNSVDKSVAPLDAALRRRFEIIELGPDLEGFAVDYLGLTADSLRADSLPESLGTVQDVRRLAINLLEVLNERIKFFLGPDFQFGQWYLAGLVGVEDFEAAKRTVVDLWSARLLPQLFDYFGGRTEQLIGVLGPALNDGRVLKVRKPSLKLEELGAAETLTVVGNANEEEILAFLLTIVTSDA